MELKKGRYRHYKNNCYIVIGTALHSETEEEMVVYSRENNTQLWVRPRKMFEEMVVVDGKSVPRFLYLGEG
jgi:hypothetical protein